MRRRAYLLKRRTMRSTQLTTLLSVMESFEAHYLPAIQNANIKQQRTSRRGVVESSMKMMKLSRPALQSRKRRRTLTESGANEASSSRQRLAPNPPAGSMQDVVAHISEPWVFGSPTCICEYSGALHWYEERSEKYRRTTSPKFSTCCLAGRVQLPLLKEPPQLLGRLLDYFGDDTSVAFRNRIRMYNSLFSYTSMRGRVDKEINKGGGPYTFRINGQNLHYVGSLVPPDGLKASFAQLYIYDTDHEITNRVNALTGGSEEAKVDQHLMSELLKMLDENNVLVQSLRAARDMFESNSRLRTLIRKKDGRTTQLPGFLSQMLKWKNNI